VIRPRAERAGYIAGRQPDEAFSGADGCGDSTEAGPAALALAEVEAERQPSFGGFGDAPAAGVEDDRGGCG
jgi:hypothetical protein